MANKWSVTPAGDFGSQLTGLGSVLSKSAEQKQLREAEEVKRAADAEAQAALYDAWQSQDPAQVAEVSAQYPGIAKQAAESLGLIQDFQKQEAVDFATQVLANPDQAEQLAERRAQLLASQGRNPEHTLRFAEGLKTNRDGAILGLKMNLAALDKGAWDAYQQSQGGGAEVPAQFQALQMRAEASGLQEGTSEYEEFMRTGGNPARLGQASAVTRTYDNGTVLKVLPDGSTEVTLPDGTPVVGEARVEALRKAREEQVEMAGARAGATSRGERSEGRLQTTIDEGLDAAQGAGVLRRAISLLDEVKTGGFDTAAIRAKQFFGVESANEGELASNLGKAILSQLKSTFGAAFTEREGARLESIEARLGANTETNKRLLQQTLTMVERAANRAIDAAYEIGDDRTARDIEDLLDFTLTDEGAEAPAERTQPAAEAQIGRFTIRPVGN